MNFAFSDEQEEIKTTLRNFLAEHATLEDTRRAMKLPRGFDPALWKMLSSELGLQGLIVPTKFGGAGLGPVELCIATRDARFAAPFVERALVPDGATTWLLPRLVGWARARRMLLFGESIEAPEAFEIGMIGELVEPAELDAAIAARTERLASLPVATLRFTKGLLRRSFESDLEALLFQERAGQGMMTSTEDYREGVAAFLERRPPQFGKD